MKDYKIQDIADYIQPVPIELIKKKLGAWLFIITVFGLTLAYGDPFDKTIFNIAVSIVVIVDLWGMYILIDTKRKQLQYTLFIGVFCMFMSIICVLTFYKNIYLDLRNSIPMLLGIIVFIYLSILLVVFVSTSYLLRTGYFSQGREKNNRMTWKIPLLVGPIAAYVTGRFLVRSFSVDISLVVFSVLFLLVGFAVEVGAHNIYKYYLIQKYKQRE